MHQQVFYSGGCPFAGGIRGRPSLNYRAIFKLSCPWKITSQSRCNKLTLDSSSWAEYPYISEWQTCNECVNGFPLSFCGSPSRGTSVHNETYIPHVFCLICIMTAKDYRSTIKIKEWAYRVPAVYSVSGFRTLLIWTTVLTINFYRSSIFRGLDHTHF